MPVGSLTHRFLQGLGAAATQPLGLAVSGGGDSMAMLHLAARAGLAVQVATVDHGLRAESAAEAAMVAAVCDSLGLPHHTLRWQGWDGSGNLQDNARLARRRLLAAWAQAQGLPAVALAHSQDDVAETFLMRLARGAGIDGLAAMAPAWSEAGVVWLRPLLAASRADLRGYLGGIGATWVDDPSNDADRFDRVKMRKALKTLAPLGLGAPRLAEVAQHLLQTRSALDAVTDAAAQRHLSETHGIVTLATALFDEPPELQRRLLQRLILWLAPAPYGPRGAALQGLLARLLAGKSAQLAGCHFLFHRARLLAFREAKAVGPAVAGAQVWDNRWRCPDAPADCEIRALGADGLAQAKLWRSLGLPRAALLSQPSLWRDGRLLAAPILAELLENGENRPVFVTQPGLALFHSALSH